MKLKAIALALFVAGAGASFALADDGHGQSNDTSTSTSMSTTTTESHGHGHSKDACRPNVAFVFNGTFVAAGSDGTSFTMKVKHANHHAKALGNPATIQTDANTRINRDGKPAKVADLKADDRLNVQARGCKNVPAGTVQTMVARRVHAHSAKSGGSDDPATTTTTASTP